MPDAAIMAQPRASEGSTASHCAVSAADHLRSDHSLHSPAGPAIFSYDRFIPIRATLGKEGRLSGPSQSQVGSGNGCMQVPSFDALRRHSIICCLRIFGGITTVKMPIDRSTNRWLAACRLQEAGTSSYCGSSCSGSHRRRARPGKACNRSASSINLGLV